MTQPRLEGKVAVVTGGASGIGRASVVAFLREGAKVVIGDITGAEEAATELGAGCLGIACDVSISKNVDALVGAAVEHFGGVDVLVNSAGLSGARVRLAEMTDDEFEFVLGVNLKGTFYAMRAAIPHMIRRGGGSIINISSVASVVHFPLTPGYAASKGGINGLTRSTAVDYAPEGIRVNTILPGRIDTPMFQRNYSEKAERQAIAATPIGRMGTSEDLAAAALFLASDEAAFVTGTIIPVDGGYMSV